MSSGLADMHDTSHIIVRIIIYQLWNGRLRMSSGLADMHDTSHIIFHKLMATVMFQTSYLHNVETNAQTDRLRADVLSDSGAGSTFLPFPHLQGLVLAREPKAMRASTRCRAYENIESTMRRHRACDRIQVSSALLHWRYVKRQRL